jgi:hypothetical protein
MTRILPFSALSSLLALAACAPQSAVLTDGSFTAFLSKTTSLSLEKWDWLPADYTDAYNVDCRTFETIPEEDWETIRAQPLGLEPLDICDSEWGGANPDGPDHEEWAFQDGFMAFGQKLEPWRGEGVITSEGDFQVGFHHRLPNGQDFRFAFVIDPDFAPTTCVQDGDKVLAEPIDGDWREEWSNEFAERYAASEDEDVQAAFAHFEPFFDGGRLWVLNAGGYQRDPNNTEAFWYFPEEYQSGFAAGKFSEERVAARAPRYAEPFIYNFSDVDQALSAVVLAEDLWHCDMAADANPADCPPCEAAATWPDFCTLQDRVDVVEREIFDELQRLNPSESDALKFRPVVLHNNWRTPDGQPPGFDGWAEMHFNYVVLSQDSNVEVGGSAKGAFSLVLDGEYSQSRFYIKGTFEVEKIRKDRWVTADLRALKFEESPDIKNEDALCIKK